MLPVFVMAQKYCKASKTKNDKEYWHHTDITNLDSATLYYNRTYNDGHTDSWIKEGFVKVEARHDHINEVTTFVQVSPSVYFDDQKNQYVDSVIFFITHADNSPTRMRVKK